MYIFVQIIHLDMVSGAENLGTHHVVFIACTMCAFHAAYRKI